LPLDSNALSAFVNGLSGLFVSMAVPVPPVSFAQQFATLYKTYALNAQSCAALAPTVVNDSALKDRIDEALALADPTYLEVAEKWRLGFKEFWTGAAFGATGAVPPGKEGQHAALKSSLAGLWQTQAATLTLFPASAQQHGTIIETYTKTVEVLDTAVPPPSGCGPAPIT
jgi:hypothetical protein